MINFFSLFLLWSSPQVISEIYPPLISPKQASHKSQKISLAFYNVLNLEKSFQHGDKINSKNLDYFHHLEDISQVLLQIDSNGPDLIALSEIQNNVVIEDLIERLEKKLGLQKFSYHFVTTEKNHPLFKCSNLAFIYKTEKFQLDAVKFLTPYPNAFRDILFVRGFLFGQRVNFFINHWLSRKNQEKGLESRLISAQFLQEKIQQLLEKHPNDPIIALGDFNDEPEDETLHDVLKARLVYEEFDPSSLVNITSYLNNGSYYFKEKWYAIDQILTSDHFFKSSLRISQPFYYNKDILYPANDFPFLDSPPLIGYRSDHKPIASIIYLEELDL